MTPRAHDQTVPSSWIVLLNCLVNPQRPGQVFSVEPAAYGEHCRSDVRQILRDVLRFPVCIVVAMLHPLVPETARSLEILCVGIGKRPHIKEELVAIERASIERL